MTALTAMAKDTRQRRARSCMVWSAVASRRRGTTASRDQCAVLAAPSGAILVVVDGIGSVPEAVVACGMVLDVVRSATDGVLSSGIPLMRRCHERLIGTRGALVALALVDAEEDLMRWVAVGGIAGLLIRAGPRARPPTEALHARDGTAGVYLPMLHEETVSIAAGDMLVLTSDGIRRGYERGMTADVPPAPLAMRILAEHARGSDDALVLVGRYHGRRGAAADHRARTRGVSA